MVAAAASKRVARDVARHIDGIDQRRACRLDRGRERCGDTGHGDLNPVTHIRHRIADMNLAVEVIGQDRRLQRVRHFVNAAKST